MNDWFYADLACPRCGTRAHDEFVTKLRPQPDGTYFTVGDRFVFDRDEVAGHGYVVLKQPAEVVHIGHVRDDIACGHWPGWAEVVIRGDRIESMRAVIMNGETLARLELLDREAIHYLRGDGEAAAEVEQVVRRVRAWLTEDPAREL